MRIGLMGGTFDPVHFGHLFIAEEARVRCQLQSVVFFPNNSPAHREGKSAQLAPETRFELMRAAIESNPHFVPSRVEIERPGASYAFDTVRHFQEEFGPQAELFFIIGADSLRDLPTWYRAEELLQMCRFIAASRFGFDVHSAAQTLAPQARERIEVMEVPGLHIASRDIRQRVRDGLPIRYLTPDSVVEMIEKQGLYQRDN